MLRRRRPWVIAGVIVGIFFVTVSLAISLAEEPLRRYAETIANDRLPDFEVKIGALRLHPFILEFDVRDVVVHLKAHVDPPLAVMPTLKAAVRVLPLLSGAIEVNVHIPKPVLATTGQQVDTMLHTPVKEDVKEQAVVWQDAVRDMMPIRISLDISEGELNYKSEPAADFIRVQALHVTVANLTNRPARDDKYPSTLYVSARPFNEGRVEVDGHADFLAKPNPRIDAQLKVERLSLAGLVPVIGHYNVHLHQGTLDLACRVQYFDSTTILVVNQFLVEGARIDYVHTAQTKQKEVKQLKKGAQKAKQMHQDPSIVVKVEHGKILHSDMGFVNKATSPDYRVFMADMNLEMDNFSNRLEEGMGTMKLTGKFMGSGPTTVTGSFRPEKPRPDFDLHVRIVKTQVEALNKLLRAYGHIETRGGMFAFFSDLSVKDDHIEGYVKPFLKDVEVYDPDQDQDKAATKKLYEAVVNGVLALFRNPTTGLVATETNVSGSVENPEADTWQILGRLVQNAFFKAILPGFAKAGRA